MFISVGKKANLTLSEADDFKLLHVEPADSDVTLEEIKSTLGPIARLDNDNFWIDVEALKALSGRAGEPEWERSFDSMIMGVKKFGWLSPDGKRVRCHLKAKWTMPVDHKRLAATLNSNVKQEKHAMPEETHWSDEVFREIKQREIASVCTVPDGGLTRLLNLVKADSSMRLITLTTEEEGMGIVTGQWLGGKRAMIAMQSSGVGNCINALGLPSVMRAPCLMLVTMRGQYGEFNPWQVQMGQGARPALEAVGVKCFPADHAEEVAPAFIGAADLAFNGGFSCAVLVSQRVIGAKGFGQK